MNNRFLLTALAGALLLAGCREEIIIPKDPPIARKDMLRTALDTPVTIAVLANDHDPNGEAMTLVSVGAPTSGSVVQNNDGTVTWTPAAGFTGGASFTYLMQDASGNQSESSAHITVGPSTRIMYLSNFEDFWTQQLYLADTAHPGVAAPLSGFIPMSEGVVRGDNDVLAYALSPDRSVVAYYAAASKTKTQADLFVVDLDQPGVALQLTDVPDGRAINTGIPPQFLADNSKVFFIGTIDNAENPELYMVDIDDASTRQRVHRLLTEDESITQFIVTPDGQRVIYFLARPIPDGADEDEEPDGSFTEVWVARLDALDAPVRLNGGLPADGTAQSLANAALSPDLRSIAWAAAEDGSTSRHLYVADYVAGTPAVRIGGSGFVSGVFDLRWAFGGEFIVYRSDQDSEFASEMFLVRLDDPDTTVKIGPTILSPDNGRPLAPTFYAIGPDDTYVIYTRADLDPDKVELFKVDLDDPGVAVRLNAPLGEGITLGDFKTALISPRRILYTHTVRDEDDRLIGSAIEMVDIDQPETVTRIGGTFTSSSSVSSLYSFDPTGQKVLYRADPDGVGAFSIQVVDLANPEITTRLTTERILGDEVTSVEFVP